MMMWYDGNWAWGGWVFMTVVMAPIWTLWAIFMITAVVIAVDSRRAPRLATPSPAVRPNDKDGL